MQSLGIFSSIKAENVKKYSREMGILSFWEGKYLPKI